MFLLSTAHLSASFACSSESEYRFLKEEVFRSRYRATYYTKSLKRHRYTPIVSRARMFISAILSQQQTRPYDPFFCSSRVRVRVRVRGKLYTDSPLTLSICTCNWNLKCSSLLSSCRQRVFLCVTPRVQHQSAVIQAIFVPMRAAVLLDQDDGHI